MNEKILTVTIPSYNVEAYLEECLESFVNSEVMGDIEVLIDGSSDDTAKIAQRYVDKYENTFRLINKKNGGHGSTINTGVREAKGKYFKVVDGDDWVDTRSFIRLVEILKESDADIVASNYTWINHTTRLPEKRQEYPFEKIEYNKLYKFEDIVGKTIIDMHATTVKTELFRKANEQIDEHTFYVDVEFIAFPIPYVRTVYFIEDPVYQYRLGLPGQSMSIQKMQKNLKNHLRVLMRLNQYCKKAETIAPTANLEYIRELTATILTSQMKIYISFPLKSGMKKEAMKLDAYFYHKNREVYDRVKNPAVLFLRKTKYAAFPLAVLAFKRRRDSY